MSIAVSQEVGCPACGARQAVLLGESVNVERAPAWRQSVLDGTFNRFACEACGEAFEVERDMLYSDLGRGVLIGCFARTRRGEADLLEAQLAETWATTVEIEAPPAVAAAFQGPGPRVVFGLAELREKVVCFDAGLDDRLVEAMKLTLLEGIAGRERAGVEELRLVAVEAGESLVFHPVDGAGRAVGDHLLSAPWVMYEDMLATRGRVAALLPGLFEGLWVTASRARPGLVRSPHAPAFSPAARQT